MKTGLPVVLALGALYLAALAWGLSLAAANRRRECDCGRVATVRVFGPAGKSWRSCDGCVPGDAVTVVPLPRPEVQA